MQLIQYLKSKLFIRTIITIILSLVIGLFLLNKFLSFQTNHDQKIEVPNLSNLTLEEANDKLKEAELSYEILDTASFNPNIPPLSVLEQNPEAGDHVKEGRKIYLTLNASTYRKIPMPDVFGKTKRQAVTQLTSAGFRVGKLSYIPDIGRVVRELKVSGKKISKGDLVPKNTEIDLVLGDGKLGNSDES